MVMKLLGNLLIVGNLMFLQILPFGIEEKSQKLNINNAALCTCT